MLSKQLLSVIAAAGVASAASSSDCAPSTVTVNSAADATNLASACQNQAIPGTVVIGSNTGAGSIIDLSGPTAIKGDLIAENNGQIVSLQSSSIGTIGGKFNIHNVTLLSNLGFSALHSVGSISWVTLNALQSLAFGTPGITKAATVEIADTFLSTLDGIDLTSVGNLDINNNRFLTSFSAQLGNVSGLLKLDANGQNLKVSFPNLLWVNNMTISNVSDFSVPSLQVVNGSARFDSNYFTNFTAPNMTSTGSGDISFVSNGNLQSLAFPQLTKTGGSLTVANNTNLAQLGDKSFPKLKTIGGAVKLRGNFTDVELPALSDVKGAFDLQSTADVSKSCTNFDKLQSNGGSGAIQGSYNCKSNNADANSDTSTNSSSGSGSKSAAAGNTYSLATVASFLAAGALIHALL